MQNLTTLPPCQLHSTQGTLNLPSDLLNQWLVLFFYPKNNTPGCTQEARDFALLSAEFVKTGAHIFGISRDSLKSHHNARERLNLPFHLISDPDEKLCHFFDVIKLKKLYGKEYMGIERSTFLINPQGDIQHTWRKVSVPGHAQSVLNKLNELQSTL
ncbi:MAG: peroxiredoxin [Halothiobacillaceae bacterium]